MGRKSNKTNTEPVNEGISNEDLEEVVEMSAENTSNEVMIDENKSNVSADNKEINEKSDMISFDDLYVSTLSLDESRKSNPEVLAVVEGPFMEIGENNRNSRVYSLELVRDRIINAPYTQEMMKNKTLFGEGCHPENRYEVLASEASHNITDLWISDDKTKLMGRADVLNTPMGRVIYTLLKYGSKLGVSARALGTVQERQGVSYVDIDSYDFRTFDFVTNPGFGSARVSPIHEAYDKELSGAVQGILESANTAQIDDFKVFLESYDGAEKSHLEGMLKSRVASLNETAQKDNDNKVSEEVQSDTSVATDLREEVKSLKVDNATLKNTILQITESRDSLEEQVKTGNKQIEDLNEQLNKQKEDNDLLKSNFRELTENNKKLEKKNKKLYIEVENAKNSKEELSDLLDKVNEENDNLRSQIDDLTREKDKLNEERDSYKNMSEEFYQSNINQQENYNILANKFNKVSSLVTSLKESLNSLKSDTLSLKVDNATLKEDNDNLIDDNNSLKNINEGLQDDNSSLKESIDNLREDKDSLKESNDNLIDDNLVHKENNKVLSDNNNSLMEEVKELHKDNESLKEDRQELAKFNSEMKDSISALRESLLSLRDINGDLSRKIKTLEGDNNSLLKEVKSSNNTSDSLKGNIKQLKEQLEILEGDNMVLREKNNKLLKSLKDSKSSYSELQEHYNELKNKYKSFTESYKSMKNSYTQLLKEDKENIHDKEQTSGLENTTVESLTESVDNTIQEPVRVQSVEDINSGDNERLSRIIKF